jgi:membrane protease YdiL (CAAX protease family)
VTGRGARPRPRRKRVVGAVLPAGTGLLGLSLAAEGDDPRFFALTLGLAGTWAAGALASGPVPAGAVFSRPGLRSVAEPVLTGAGTFGLFYAAARVARRSPGLHRAISSVLGYMDTGPSGLVLLTACLNAVAEEVFFHGALWDAVGPDHPEVATAAVYTGATVATRNPALVLGGAVTSLIFGAQRRRSGGVAAPAIAHVVWSVLMLTLLPPLFATSPDQNVAVSAVPDTKGS